VIRADTLSESEVRSIEGLWYSRRILPLRGGDTRKGVAVTFSDITARKSAQDALRESQAQLTADLAGMRRLYEVHSKLANETNLDAASVRFWRRQSRSPGRIAALATERSFATRSAQDLVGGGHLCSYAVRRSPGRVRRSFIAHRRLHQSIQSGNPALGSASEAKPELCEGRRAYNFGECKGLSFERVLIIPPDRHAKFLCEIRRLSTVPTPTIRVTSSMSGVRARDTASRSGTPAEASSQARRYGIQSQKLLALRLDPQVEDSVS
jgi:hypothetical protein